MKVLKAAKNICYTIIINDTNSLKNIAYLVIL